MKDYEFRDGLKYGKTHEWVDLDGDIATIGITDYAQCQLGDIVFVDCTLQPGDAVASGEVALVVESVKAVGEVYAPVTGEVVEVNGALEGRPELVNEAPFGDGWLVKVRVSDPGELDGLLGVEEYRDLVAELEGS
ncbi:MAG: glycine cleavage system protein GcvH [Promethearchaeota archaeon]